MRLFHPRTIALGICISIFASAGSLQAQVDPTIASVSTTVAGLFEQLSLTGTDFVGPKPKVWLQQDGEKKKFALKVLTVNEAGTELTAEVRKGLPGEFGLFVQNKGKGTTPVQAPTMLTLVPPTLTGINPSMAPVGTVVTLEGDNLGSKKLKLKIGGKKAKPKFGPSVGDGGNSWTVVVPKSLANGLWAAEIASKLGATTLPEALIATGSTKKIGKPALQATANGSSFTVKGKTLGAQTVAGNIQVNASVGNNPNRAVVMTIPFDIATDQAPQSFTVADFGTSLSYTENTVVSLNPPVIDNKIWMGLAQPWSITVNASSGGQVALTFEGTLDGSGEPDTQISGTAVIAPTDENP